MLTFDRLLPSQLTPEIIQTLDELRVKELPLSDMTLLLRMFRSESLSSLDAKVFIVLAREEQHIMGWSTLEIFRGRYLLNVFVEPSHRLKGIGKALTLKVREFSPRAPWIDHPSFYSRVLPEGSYCVADTTNGS